MNYLKSSLDFLKTYFPMFLLLGLSGNPLITTTSYSKIILIAYSLILIAFAILSINIKDLKKGLGILTILLVFILTIVFFQSKFLGFVSYPGVISFFIKIVLGLTTLIFYKQRKIDFLDVYIKTAAILVIVSLLFFVLNQFVYFGLELKSSITKSLILHTMILKYPDELIARNCGMFWEPGAFSGYLILALVFVALKNRKFQIGPYSKEVVIIFIGVLTTMSTTGFLILAILLLLFAFQNYRRGRIIVIPLIAIMIGLSYFNLDFMKNKINSQFKDAIVMNDDDISSSRFGALKMDLQYIKSQPVFGNGLHIKTRFRFHPEIKGDIGHGNGMSNFIASWGIPLFLFWMICLIRFSYFVSKSKLTAFASLSVILLLLQGEQFLNYPLFLSFFALPFVYQNILSEKSKIFIIKNYIKVV